MNLERVTVEMRPRGEWEAADLGARMVRRDARAIYAVWFAVTLPMLLAALLLIAFSPWPALVTLLYWWFEPVADGPILRIISRRLFGEDADIKAALRQTFSLAWQNKLFWLTPYRLHFARSIAMPVTQLEGLTGETRRARAKVLNLRIQNHGIGVTVAYQHLFTALYVGLILFGFLLVPTAYQDTLGDSWLDSFWVNDSRIAAALSLLTLYAAQSMLQPWFVGAGFGLYINCRTQLEAWDLEVAFRRMVQRRANGLANAAMLALCVLSPLLLTAQPAGAQASQDSEASDTASYSGYWSESDLRDALHVVEDDQRLSTSEEVTTWQSREQREPQPPAEENGWWSTTFRSMGQFIALLLEFGLWLGLLLLAALVLATAKYWLPYLNLPQRQARSVRPRVMLASGEITEASLPEDIPAAVAELWRSGDERKALSLLYRGSVFAAVQQHGVRLPRSATEGACVTAVTQQTGGTQAAFFRRIVDAWVLCAYGFRTPSAESVMPLVAEWPQHYGERR